MDELGKIRFPRCVIPLEGQFKKPLFWCLGMDRKRLVVCWSTSDGRGMTARLYAAW
jgi:hypothetical protein